MADTPTNMKVAQSSLRDEIVEMRKALMASQKNMEQSYVRNEDDHKILMTQMAAYDTEIKVRNARDEEKDRAEQSLRKQVFALAVLFMSILSGLVAWAAMEFNELHRDVSENTAHFREFQAIGIEWGENIDERANGIKEDLRQLRRLVNEHQRNKQEHSR